MFQCRVCGNARARSEFVSEVFLVAGRHVLVENIPAQVYERCGEVTFSRDVTEKVRQFVHGQAPPLKTVTLEVFALT